MSGRIRSDDTASSEPDAADRDCPDGPRPTPRLELALVSYEERPDRCTIHPPQTTGIERMSTWISVDRSLVVDAGSMR